MPRDYGYYLLIGSLALSGALFVFLAVVGLVALIQEYKYYQTTRGAGLWVSYTNSELGLTFRYPEKWGDVRVSATGAYTQPRSCFGGRQAPGLVPVGYVYPWHKQITFSLWPSQRVPLGVFKYSPEQVSYTDCWNGQLVYVDIAADKNNLDETAPPGTVHKLRNGMKVFLQPPLFSLSGEVAQCFKLFADSAVVSGCYQTSIPVKKLPEASAWVSTEDVREWFVASPRATALRANFAAYRRFISSIALVAADW